MIYYVLYQTDSGRIKAWSNKNNIRVADGCACVEIDTDVDLTERHMLYQIQDQQLVLRPTADQLQHEQTLELIRRQRNYRLAQTDWTQLPDVDLSAGQLQQWQQYRQALRDITDNLPDLLTEDYKPNWPNLPE
jgi:hypothetical protein